MNDEAKSEWNEKALQEKVKLEKEKKKFEEHGDWLQVPGRWLSIKKKKAETSASSKKKTKAVSPKKKTAKIAKTVKKNTKKTAKAKSTKKNDSSSDSDSDSSSSESSSSESEIESESNKKKKRRVPRKTTKVKKVEISTKPNVITRSAAKNDPSYSHTQPIERYFIVYFLMALQNKFYAFLRLVSFDERMRSH